MDIDDAISEALGNHGDEIDIDAEHGTMKRRENDDPDESDLHDEL